MEEEITYNKEELIQRVAAIKDVKKQYNEIYEVLTELKIKFKKTTCKRCLQDLLNICKEELGMIESAAESSSFNKTTRTINTEWVYLHPFPIGWTYNGERYLMDKYTPSEIIEEFVKTHKYFYKKNKK